MQSLLKLFWVHYAAGPRAIQIGEGAGLDGRLPLKEVTWKSHRPTSWGTLSRPLTGSSVRRGLGRTVLWATVIQSCPN